MDTYRNPVYTQTNQGQIIQPSWENQRGIINSHIVQVDSRVRNFDLFTNPNHFRIKLPQIYHNVASIELLHACIPIVPNTPLQPADEKYVVMRLRGIPGGSGAEPTGISTNNSPIFDEAFAKIPLIEHFSGIGFTFWRKDELRAITHFQPRRSELAELEISLVQMGTGTPLGTVVPYPLTAVVPPVTLTPNPEVTYVFEIVSSN